MPAKNPKLLKSNAKEYPNVFVHTHVRCEYEPHGDFAQNVKRKLVDASWTEGKDKVIDSNGQLKKKNGIHLLFGLHDLAYPAWWAGAEVFKEMTDLRDVVKYFGTDYVNHDAAFMKLSEVRDFVNAKGMTRFFMKPAVDEKLFGGGLYSPCENNERFLSNFSSYVPHNTPCLVASEKGGMYSYSPTRVAVIGRKVVADNNNSRYIVGLTKEKPKHVEFVEKLIKKMPKWARNVSFDVMTVNGQWKLIEPNSIHAAVEGHWEPDLTDLMSDTYNINALHDLSFSNALRKELALYGKTAKENIAERGTPDYEADIKSMGKQHRRPGI